MPGIQIRRSGILWLLLLALTSSQVATSANSERGIAIAHSPPPSQNYIGSPSMAILDNGTYIASHDFFGDGDKLESTQIFESNDQGKNWNLISTLDNQFWSNLFIHQGKLYILGTAGEHQPVVIRESTDGGHTWSEPRDSHSGLISDNRAYHGSAVPIARFNGKLWRAFEIKGEKRVVLFAINESDNLLEKNNWQQFEYRHPESLSDWLEGNVIVTPEGTLAIIFRRDFKDDTAATLHLSEEHNDFYQHDQDAVIDFPGGGVKFTIRYDPLSKQYWAITNQQTDPAAVRNRVVLISSPDLRKWTVKATLLEHEDAEHRAWQYFDWQFDGKDIIAVARTAADDNYGGAENAYRANYFTFHRFRDFRDDRK